MGCSKRPENRMEYQIYRSPGRAVRREACGAPSWVSQPGERNYELRQKGVAGGLHEAVAGKEP